MKRHQQLQDLSREHHNALKLALHARRAAMSGDQEAIAASAQACRTAFLAELEPHFLLEEASLLPLLVLADEQELARRTACEHDEMRTLIAQLKIPDAGALERFAELLSAHVRFEERVLFEALQRHLA